MNEIPFTEVYWNKWFQLGGIIMFVCGFLFSTLFPLLNWHKYKANLVCIVLYKVYYRLPYKAKSNPDLVYDLADAATQALVKTGTEKFGIRFNNETKNFEVVEVIRM